MSTMTPDDVYALVDARTVRTFWTLCGVAVLVVIKLTMDVVSFRRSGRTDERINRVLDIVEGHADITDRQAERVTVAADEMKEAAKDIKSVLAPHRNETPGG